MPYLTLFYRLVVRPLRREPLRTFLTAVAVALGVAVSSPSNWPATPRRVPFAPRSKPWPATPTSKSPYPAVSQKRSPAGLAPRPLASRRASRTSHRHRAATVPLIGVDYAEGSRASRQASANMSANLPSLRSRIPKRMQIPHLDRLPNSAINPGDRVRLQINDRADYMVRGVFGERSGEVVVMDLAPATRALGRTGRLDRILIKVPPGTDLDRSPGNVLKVPCPRASTVHPRGAAHQRKPPHARSLPLESAGPQLHRAGGRRFPHLQHDLGFRGAPPRRNRHRPRARRHRGPRARRLPWRSRRASVSWVAGSASRSAALLAAAALSSPSPPPSNRSTSAAAPLLSSSTWPLCFSPC